MHIARGARGVLAEEGATPTRAILTAAMPATAVEYLLTRYFTYSLTLARTRSGS